MLDLFIPKKYVKSYNQVDVVNLRENNIKLIICDIDNTLVAHDEEHPNEQVKAFVRTMKEAGFLFCLISNNVSTRVEIFSKDLDVKIFPMAKKPLKITYRKIMREFQVNADEIASIGDQLLTDVLGGNRVGIYTILTSPLVSKDLKCTKINRIFENIVFRQLEKKKYLIKGEFDEQ